ncbi:hypothetical protein HF265_31050 [Rhizobium leguminosarum]|nr:hypothetical protein [Rhizobium leguminosarum]MBY2923070.1 hypothetical protein [Rhizobium leguminosarum]MBY3033470.1 hypothetical protein [Rhizobium leguminosarum]
MPVVRANQTELLLGNNSSIRVGTSLRSGTLQYLHISEYGKLCAKYPDKAREVRTGALNKAGEEHRKRLAAAEAAEQAAKDTLEIEIQSYELQLSEKNRACAVTAADRQWLLRH